MSTQEYIRSVTEIVPDDFPSLTEDASSSLFSNITWQTWIIIILILSLLGINIFAYLAKGTEESVSLISKIFGPILRFFGYSTLTTTRQIVETTATGTKSGVDIASDAAIGTLDTIQQTAETSSQMSNSIATTGQSYTPALTASSFSGQQSMQHARANVDEWQQDSLEKALDNAKQSTNQIRPDDSRSSIQTTGKSGWCYIGEEQGIRTCSEIGVNDVCMSGNVFPNQSICMNPNLRA